MIAGTSPLKDETPSYPVLRLVKHPGKTEPESRSGSKLHGFLTIILMSLMGFGRTATIPWSDFSCELIRYIADIYKTIFDTGLIYMWNRWQDPETGRFVSEDPARDGSNWYAYAANSPLVFIDPTGLDPVGAAAGTGLGGSSYNSNHSASYYQNTPGTQSYDAKHGTSTYKGEKGLAPQLISWKATTLNVRVNGIDIGEKTQFDMRVEPYIPPSGQTSNPASQPSGVHETVISTGFSKQTGPLAALVPTVSSTGNQYLDYAWGGFAGLANVPSAAGNFVLEGSAGLSAWLGWDPTIVVALELKTSMLTARTIDEALWKLRLAAPSGGVRLPGDLLTTALKRQGLTKAPSLFKEKWLEDGVKYEVRVHPADPRFGKTGDIFRVARQRPGVGETGQGNGWEYMDSSGNWWPERVLKVNSSAAEATHIQL